MPIPLLNFFIAALEKGANAQQSLQTANPNSVGQVGDVSQTPLDPNAGGMQASGIFGSGATQMGLNDLIGLGTKANAAGGGTSGLTLGDWAQGQGGAFGEQAAGQGGGFFSDMMRGVAGQQASGVGGTAGALLSQGGGQSFAPQTPNMGQDMQMQNISSSPQSQMQSIDPRLLQAMMGFFQ